MKLSYDKVKKKLIGVARADERNKYLIYIVGAKFNPSTALWEIPIKSLIALVALNPEIIPQDKDTEDLINKAKALITNLEETKALMNSPEFDKLYNKVCTDTTFLMKHQVLCNIISKSRKRFAFFLDTGTRQNSNKS